LVVAIDAIPMWLVQKKWRLCDAVFCAAAHNEDGAADLSAAPSSYIALANA
jgi:hypothetical protein